MIDEIINHARHFNPDLDEQLVRRAYELADLVHAGQKRKSGAPHMEHILAVVGHLLKVKAGSNTLTAAFLHDVLPTKDVTEEELVKEFGDEVAGLVTGVARLKQIRTKVGDPGHRENLRNLILAAGRDIRVVLIRLADKLHNLETLETLTEDEKRLAVDKALTIYVPLAERLGVFYFKRRFEDLALKYREPEIYRQIEDYYRHAKTGRDRFVSETVTRLQDLLISNQIEAEIFGRTKHYYSVYRKFLSDHKRRRPDDTVRDYLSKLQDKFAFTILVNSVEECYRVLDLLHQTWRFDPAELDDYIAAPKPNGYQSLQTALFVRADQPIEIQIKTHVMHEYNEYGPASHIFYKEMGRVKGSQMMAPEKKIVMLRELLRWQEKLDQARSDQTRADLEIRAFQDRVFVFTPQGDVHDLLKGATPIDFAYAVHTQVGESTVGAKVNDRIVPLSYELQNGDVCEILTTKQPKKPSYDWLKIAKTKFARSQIRQRLNE